MFYLKGKNKDYPVHGPSPEGGRTMQEQFQGMEVPEPGGGHLDQVHCLMPGIGAQGGSSDGDFTLGKAGRTGRGSP